MLPVIFRKRGSASSSAASLAERPSFHRMQGRSGRPALSISVAPCMWPERPMPLTRFSGSGWSRQSASIALEVALTQLSGSCSDQPGCGRSTARAARCARRRSAGRRRSAPPSPTRCRHRSRDTWGAPPPFGARGDPLHAGLFVRGSNIAVQDGMCQPPDRRESHRSPHGAQRMSGTAPNQNPAPGRPRFPSGLGALFRPVVHDPVAGDIDAAR